MAINTKLMNDVEKKLDPNSGNFDYTTEIALEDLLDAGVPNIQWAIGFLNKMGYHARPGIELPEDGGPIEPVSTATRNLVEDFWNTSYKTEYPDSKNPRSVIPVSRDWDRKATDAELAMSGEDAVTAAAIAGDTGTAAGTTVGTDATAGMGTSAAVAGSTGSEEPGFVRYVQENGEEISILFDDLPQDAVNISGTDDAWLTFSAPGAVTGAGTGAGTGADTAITAAEGEAAEQAAAQADFPRMWQQYIAGLGPQTSRWGTTLGRMRPDLETAYNLQVARDMARMSDESILEARAAVPEGSAFWAPGVVPVTFLDFLRGQPGTRGTIGESLPGLRDLFNVGATHGTARSGVQYPGDVSLGGRAAREYLEGLDVAPAAIRSIVGADFSRPLRGAIESAVQERINALYAQQAADAARLGVGEVAERSAADPAAAMGIFEQFLRGNLPHTSIATAWGGEGESAVREAFDRARAGEELSQGQETAIRTMEGAALPFMTQALSSRFAPALRGTFADVLGKRVERFKEKFPQRKVFGEYLRGGFNPGAVAWQP